MLFQNADDLLFGVAFALHIETSRGSILGEKSLCKLVPYRRKAKSNKTDRV
jgi:hypothetical protein